MASGIKVRQVSADTIYGTANTAIGLASNGTVHPVPTLGKDGETVLVKFYTQSGEQLPREYFQLMVENEDLVLEGLTGETLLRMKARLAEMRTYLELSTKACPREPDPA